MTKTMRGTAMAVLLSFSSSFIVAPAHAAIVSTEQAVAMHQQDRSELKQFFDREDIANALQSHGVSPEAAKARVDSMTEEEAQKLAAHIENAPAGAGIVGDKVHGLLLLADAVASEHRTDALSRPRDRIRPPVQHPVAVEHDRVDPGEKFSGLISRRDKDRTSCWPIRLCLLRIRR